MNVFLFQYINSFAFRWLWLDTFSIFFAHYFGYIVIVLPFLFILGGIKKYKFFPVLALFSGGLAVSLVKIFRFFFYFPRPFIENNVNLLINYHDASSFPSGHAAFFFGFAAGIFFLNKRVGFWFLIFAFLISLARVLSGIHWPIDILVGSLVGIFFGYVSWLIYKKYYESFN